MRFLRQSMIGFFLAAVTLGLLAYAATTVGGALRERMAQEPRTPPARERVFTVNVVTAEVRDQTPVLTTFGEVRSRRLLELRAAGGGRVIEIAQGFEDGGRVTQGEVLVRLNPADMQSSLDRAAGDVADAQAEGRDAARGLELAQQELSAAQEQADLRSAALDRQRDLAQRGVGTTISVETAELAASAARQAALTRAQAVAQAEARIDQAASQLARAEIAQAEAQRRLGDMTIAAPFDGTLSDTNLVVGRLVSPNEQLATLTDPNDLELSFRVSTAQYARLLDEAGALLRADVVATLDVAGVDLEARGQISRESVTAGEGATGRLIFAQLQDAPGFKPGDFVTVRIQEPTLPNVVRLPASAVDANAQVLVLGDNNRLEAATVTVLRTQGDDVLVRGPIEGREVVEARSPLLGVGIAVTPLRKGVETPTEPEMVALTDERRAKLVAFIEGNDRMPEAAKARVLAQLSEPEVPARTVARIEGRMGG